MSLTARVNEKGAGLDCCRRAAAMTYFSWQDNSALRNWRFPPSNAP